MKLTMITRGRAFTAGLLLIPPLVGLMIMAYASSHAVLPGLTGCGYVRDADAQGTCFEERIGAMFAEQGPEETLAQLAEVPETARGTCHMGAHDVTERRGAALARAGEPLPALSATSFCGDGLVHGLYIGYLESAELDAQLVREVGARCSETEGDGPKSRRTRLNCAHAFGHSAAVKAGPERASQACGEVRITGTGTPAPLLAFECRYGMYMEYTMRDAKRSGADVNNCTSAPADAMAACYSFLPSRVSELTDDASRVERACDDAPAGQPEALCRRGIAEEQPA